MAYLRQTLEVAWADISRVISTLNKVITRYY